MGKCESCGGCSGCGLELELTEEEISFLHRLGECAFLPVIQEKEAPVFPEEAGKELLLQILEKKGLISLDYDKPLKDYHTPAYDASPVRGSMALTKRGQDVLELMLAGATAVGVGAANLVEPYACKHIIETLPDAMARFGIDNLRDIIGGAHHG